MLAVEYKASEDYIKKMLTKFIKKAGFKMVSSKISDTEDVYICEVERKFEFAPPPGID